MSTPKKLAASAAVLVAVAGFVSAGVFSAFTSSVSNTSTLGSGKVELSNTPTSLLVSLTNLIPGDLLTRCIAVENTGNVPVDVTMTKSTGGTDAATLLGTGGLIASIEQGTVDVGETPDANCTGFTASGVYKMGTSVIDTSGNITGGSLVSSLSTDTVSNWAAGSVKYFRVKIAMPKDVLNTLQNLSATLSLTFQAASQAGSLTR
jgi:hypothetical protein